MLSRRSFLLGMGAIALGQIASGCNNQVQQNLRVRLLKSSIPPQLLQLFRGEEKTIKLSFKAEVQLVNLFKLLKTWKKQKKNLKKKNIFRPLLRFVRLSPPLTSDLVTLGDYWLEKAIDDKLIQPLDIEELDLWPKLPQRWQDLVRRNDKGKLDPSGKIWGAPYRWGSTVIAYNREKFESEGWDLPQDWDALWRPELRDRLSLLDQPREVIGLTLKKLGYSYNQENLEQVPGLKEELIALNKQVKLYSSDAYLQPLILGDTDIAVGWSTDLVPLQASYPQIEIVMPASGTAIWADIWVKPSSVKESSQDKEKEDSLTPSQEWINFCWQQESAKQIALLTEAASPMLETLPKEELPKDILDNNLIMPEESIWRKSEFLLPVSKQTLKQYESLRKEINEL